MTVTTRPTEPPAAADREIVGPEFVQRRIHVQEYHRMIEPGILDEDDKVELLEGVLVEMWPVFRTTGSSMSKVEASRCTATRTPRAVGIVGWSLSSVGRLWKSKGLPRLSLPVAVLVD